MNVEMTLMKALTLGAWIGNLLFIYIIVYL